MSDSGLIVWSPVSSNAFRFTFFEVRVKYIRWNFFFENEDSWRFAYDSHAVYIRFSVMQFCSVDELCVRIFTSFTKPVALVRNCMFSQASNKSALYIKYKIGEIGEPCGIPVETLLSGSIKSFIRSSVDLSVKKLWIQRVNGSGILLFRRLCRSLACDTQSNASLTLRLNRDATLYLFPPYIAWIFFVISCNAVSVNLIRRAPI
jgi:hypothetical protein